MAVIALFKNLVKFFKGFSVWQINFNFFPSEPKVTNFSPRRHSTRISRKSISSSEAQTPSDVKENLAIKIDLPPPREDGKLKRLAIHFLLIKL